MTAQRRARRIISADDARLRAKRVLPRMVFDMVDGGADGETTLASNLPAFREVVIRPRVAVHVEEPDLATTVLGTPVSMPVLTAPTGLNNLVHPRAEVGVAAAAHRAGTIAVLATGSSKPLEDVAEQAGGALWFQLYFYSGRPGAEELIGRARAAGYRALVVTVDTPLVGYRERDIRNRATPPLRVGVRSGIRFAPQVATRPRWLYRFVRGGMRLEMAHGTRPGAGRTDSLPADEMARVLANHPPTWADIAWIRSIWDRPLLVKGVLTREDARRAVDAGADGVIVSNHGGRQLDSVAASLRALREVVDEIGDEVEILLDGGVRRGGDVVKALATGARAVMIGRPYLYGLAVAGDAGAERILELLRADLSRTLVLMGCESVGALDRSWIDDGRTIPST